MIKRWAVFILTLVLFTTIATAATSCTSTNDIILTLSATTNAHAELYSESFYDEEICFSTFFPLPIPTRANCDGTNTILKLSATTNAHAEGPTQTNYGTNVCYGGGLACAVKSSCLTNETEILKLSATTNAHLEISTQSNYNSLLCCAIGGVTDSNPYWYNSSGVEITTARVGETIFPTLTNYGGTPDNSFNITEQDAGGAYNQILDLPGSQSTNGADWEYAWTITQGDLDNTADYKNFTFEINTISSRDLEITFCGDWEKQTDYGEQCDDGNNQDGDGCSSTCLDEVFGNKQWFNLVGDPITTAEQGDEVELRYSNNIEQDDFIIYEEDPFFDDEFATIPGIPNSQNITAIWTIPTGILGAEPELDGYEIYFEIDGDTSDILEVSGEDNDLPSGEILTPACGTDLPNATATEINFTVSDTDSLLEITLTVNGEDVFSETSQGGTFSVDHTFTTESGEEGITEIILRASETNGQGKVKATSNIIVYNSTEGARYVAACIKEPKDYSNIVTDYAFFNASTTRAANYSGVTLTDLPFSDLLFDWTFSDGMDHPDNDGANLISREFHKYFNRFGDNWANLEVTFKP
jgi:cysteine-rich repeat protein